MSDKEIISAVKYVSRIKSWFMLSEIRDYVKGEATTEGLYEVVRPMAFDMGLKMEPEDNDYRVIRMPPASVLILSEEGRKTQELFLESPYVPDKVEKLIEQYVEKKTAKAWDDPTVLEKIRKAIVAQKAGYWREGKKRKISYEKGYSILGYLAYQFPVYFVQFEHIFHELALDGILKDRMKVLDVGTGPGTVALAIIDYLRRLNRGEAAVYSLEKYDENIEAFMSLAPGYARGTGVSVEKPIKADLLKITPDDVPADVDLMVFSNVLNELDGDVERKAEAVATMAKKLAKDGSIIIIEPADKANSMEMRRLTSALMDKGLGVYSPCSFIWCARCRPESCWTFQQKDDIKPTALMLKVACDEPYRFVNTDIKYSYAVLRKDSLTREKYRVPPKAKFARLSKMRMHVERHINVVASVMSGDLGDDKSHVFKLCDGTSVKPVYAVLPSYHISANNEALMKARYGQVVEIYGVLARYNKDNDAYNLLITRNTMVRYVSSGCAGREF